MSDFNFNVDVMDVADYLIVKDSARAEPDVTPMKLQKMLYVAQANFLAATGQRMFNEPIEAFEHGPVVYRVFKRFSGKQIVATHQPHRSLSPEDSVLPENVQTFLDKIWDQLKDSSASQLRDRTHRESPWKESFELGAFRVVIPDNSMRDFYLDAIPVNKRIFHDSVVVIPENLFDESEADDSDSFEKLRALINA